MDGINGEMIRALWWAIPQHLMALYEQCLVEGYFQSEWKVGDVVVLLKSPDKIRSNPRSYRPICLLSALGKTLERVIVGRMEDKKVGRNVNQFGFTKFLSTEDAWYSVRQKVQNSDKEYVLGIFVDFTGAFDNLLWSKIIEKLEQIGCEEIDIWKSYFNDRTACMNGVRDRVTRIVSAPKDPFVDLRCGTS